MKFVECLGINKFKETIVLLIYKILVLKPLCTSHNAPVKDMCGHISCVRLIQSSQGSHHRWKIMINEPWLPPCGDEVHAYLAHFMRLGNCLHKIRCYWSLEVFSTYICCVCVRVVDFAIKKNNLPAASVRDSRLTFSLFSSRKNITAKKEIIYNSSFWLTLNYVLSWIPIHREHCRYLMCRMLTLLRSKSCA